MDNEHGNGKSKFLTPNNEDNMPVPPKTLGSSSSEASVESKVTHKTTTISQESGLESKAAISSPELSGHSMQGSSSTVPPAYSLQTLGHPPGYDPNRIPSAVFATKPASPMEWSVASNESLFSIQMGNNSFSRDHVFMLYKSGELPKLDDMINFSNSLPPMPEVDETNKRSENMEKGSQVAQASPDSRAENDQREANKQEVLEEADHTQLKAPPANDTVNSKSISYRSEGSNNSTRSFAFPVLEGEAGRLSSMKVDVDEKQQSQKNQQQQQEQPPLQTSETTPKTSAGNSWFSCFSFCKIGCC
ncbi:hypothetical protein HS088_TW15G01108 [Tripterygium wilfordii]|uniref:Uncharacterized protein n=1 Tax=Tripterygium wilfordii TaxID=458696 RepID=A0A7J7CNL4_TRIWF|nr:uncharacterized protein LOC119980100 [Tripterygium wilfordii]KAF5735599.1 hypothetical protein HS088_TW15G01108 [Tripterygium wilfordii]